jgi:hypothetical protein
MESAMKMVFRLYRRGRKYYCEHNETGQQESLRKCDKAAATRLLNARNEATQMTEATRSLVTAMTRSGGHRLVCISALGVGDSRGHGGFVFDRMFQPLLLRNAYKEKNRQEATIRSSSLDWVVVRPGMLTNDLARGSVRAFTDLVGVKGGKVARADVARFAVEQLTTDTWLRQTPVISW